jgi:hypothetical protein
VKDSAYRGRLSRASGAPCGREVLGRRLWRLLQFEEDISEREQEQAAQESTDHELELAAYKAPYREPDHARKATQERVRPYAHVPSLRRRT